MKLYAYVMHNVGPTMFWEYDPENLHHAHTFQVEADNIEGAANLIWDLTNIGDADELRLKFPHLSQYVQQVTEYRKRGNRSLSVGDAVVFLERERPAGAKAVASLGWSDVPFDPKLLTNVSNNATTSDAHEAHQQFAKNPTWRGYVQ